MTMRVLDLGCKTGGSLTCFRRQAPRRFGPQALVRPEHCVGIDLKAEYRAAVEKRGYGFRCADVLRDETWAELPARIDYCLAWDFLEHLPSREASDAVLQRMLERAGRLVWLRMPSFEPDALERLEQEGLRPTWTTWSGHPSHYQLADVRRVVAERPEQSFRVRVTVSKMTRHSLVSWLVPANAPPETTAYAPEMGFRRRIEFSPPIVSQWDVFLTRS